MSDRISEGALSANCWKSCADFWMSPFAPVSALDSSVAELARSLQLPEVAKFGAAVVLWLVVVAVVVVAAVVVWVVVVFASVDGVAELFEPPPPHPARARASPHRAAM